MKSGRFSFGTLRDPIDDPIKEHYGVGLDSMARYMD
jgi:hypothetical protein